MSLLESVVLLDVVEVVSSNDDGPFHLHAFDDASQDSPTDAHIASERTLLVYVGTFNCLHNLIKSLIFTKLLGYLSPSNGMIQSSPIVIRLEISCVFVCLFVFGGGGGSCHYLECGMCCDYLLYR